MSNEAFDRAVKALRDEFVLQKYMGQDYAKLVRTVLEAVREPDGKMLEAVRQIGGYQWVMNAKATWPTMVDELLKP